MRTEESEDREDGGALLRRELRLPHNARFLRGLAPFRLEQEVPEMLVALLRDLEAAEAGSAPESDRSDQPAASPRRGN